MIISFSLTLVKYFVILFWVINVIKKYEEKLIELRREFHQIPEPGYSEFKTKEKIIEYLKNLGIEDIKEVGETGVCAVIYGNGTKTVGLRADIDALKITEETGLSFSSVHEGYMHACGHDGHIAMSLIVAEFFNTHKDLLKGNLKLIFQPAEEVDGGAQMMIEKGVLQNPKVDCMLSGHLWPSIETGYIDISEGTTFASDTLIEIELMGKGGHAAYPEMVKNVVLCGSEIIIALDNLSREFNKKGYKNVLSMCSFDCASGNNIFKDNAHLKGTLRMLDEKSERLLSKAISDTVLAICNKYDIKCECDVILNYIPLVNDTQTVKKVREAVSDALGKDKIIELGYAMTAEDFAYFAKAVPSCHLKIGTRIDGYEYPLHNSRYNLNEKSLITGVEAFVNGIIKLLED